MKSTSVLVLVTFVFSTVFSEWIDDGSLTLRGTYDVAEFMGADSSSDNIYNYLWKEQILDGQEKYFTLEILEGDKPVAFGVTSMELFKAGYAIKYGAYNGVNGALVSTYLLLSEYGPKFTKGDEVGLLVNVSNNSTLVWFYINGRPLGLAFDLPQTQLDSPVYPVASFKSPGKVRIAAGKVPEKRGREAISTTGYDHQKWLLSSVECQDDCPAEVERVQSIIANQTTGVTMYYSQAPTQDPSNDCFDIKLRFRLLFGNIIATSAKACGDEHMIVSVSMAATTLMAPPPLVATVENYFVSVFSQLSKIPLVDDNIVLQLSNGVSFVFKPFLDTSTQVQTSILL